MLYKIAFLPKADTELSEAAAWHESGKPGLGDEFLRIIKYKLLLIQDYPKRYPKIDGHLRQVSIKKFPYCIVYFIMDKENKIIITSIFHHSRNPADKFRR